MGQLGNPDFSCSLNTFSVVNMAVKCFICKETVDKKRKTVGYLECVKLNCANLVHIACTTLNPKYIAKLKQDFQCEECKATDLTYKHVSTVTTLNTNDSSPSDNSINRSDLTPPASAVQEDNSSEKDSDSEYDSISGQTVIDFCEKETCNSTRVLLLDRVSSLETELSALKTQGKITNSKEILNQLVKITGCLEEVRTEVADLKKTNSIIMELHKNPPNSHVNKDKLLIKKMDTKKRSFPSNKVKMCECNILKLPKKVAIAHFVAADLKMSDGLALHIKNKYKIDTNELLKLNKKKRRYYLSKSWRDRTSSHHN
ncbi:LOW QUALITY PROTEIN: Potassium-transporting ATPase ATP-binding subunit [Frankliniella fusca]|uniref:Potassium-transporting ATPase ATP-binding subunit n=1 Tax=Frankliniella fusca TaxID=407009 RepID=A0AAE1HZK2_9NEOP|nr:LOW QUALITY PROTEIN: Potassium-transporting ATPase ATP-binding subunit [Frankliniella fusca]